MSRISTVDPSRIEGFEDVLARQEELVGLVPESLLTMAHRPRMARLFAELASEVLGPGSVGSGLKQLVAYVVSSTAGCRYCQAHTAVNAERLGGVEPEKIAAAFLFDIDERFHEPERAALQLAVDAAQIPNRVGDAHFKRLKEHFTEEQIAEIVGVIALFGWLNRWNDTMATTLEDDPREWAEHHIAAAGWEVGRHGAGVRQRVAD